MFLLKWLRNSRHRRQLRRRGLFRFHDGHRERWGDPFTIWRNLQNHPELNLATMGPLIDLGQEPETSIAIDALCEVFAVDRFDDVSGEGMTDWEVLNLLNQLDAYLTALKKNTSPPRTSSPVTGSASSTSPAAESAGTTSASSASGSTAAASSSA